MAQLVGLIVSDDDAFEDTAAAGAAQRPVPVSVVDERRSGAAQPEVVVVDARRDAGVRPMAQVERLRRSTRPSPSSSWREANPDADPPVDARRRQRVLHWPPAEETFHEAIRRTAARREARRPRSTRRTTLVFFGAKGGAGTTTMAVNCAVELARLTQARDGHRRPEAGSRRSGAVPRRPQPLQLLDAIDNLHRLDREFLRELVVKHKSGLEILAGSDQFDRPGRGRRRRIEEMLRLLAPAVRVHRDRRRQPDQLLLGGGALHGRHDLPGRQSRRAVDPQRAAAARSRPAARACGERVRVLLNRAAEPFPIPPAQIESALGHPIHHMFPSDYKTVSARSELRRAAGADRQHATSPRSSTVHAPHARSGGRAAARRDARRADAWPRTSRFHLVTAR